MKKILCLSLALVMMLFCLTACGGPDLEPMSAAYETAAASFNELADLVNDNQDQIGQEIVDVFNQISDVLSKYATMIENGEVTTQEQADKMTEWLESVVPYCETTTQQIQSSLAALQTQ